MAVKIQLRRGTTSQWDATVDSVVGGTILSAGEVGVNTETKQMKVGDGSTRWVSLPYFASGTITTITAGSGITVDGTIGGSSTSGTATLAVDTNYVMARNIVNAKGDLIVGSANDTPSILTVGATANHVLLVDSTTATGVKWGAIPTLNQSTTGNAATATTAGTVTTAAQPNITSVTTGTFTAGTFSGSGASLTALNATNLSSGTVSSALMPSVMYTTDGAASTKKITIQDGGNLPTTSLLNGDICFIY